MTNFTEKSAVEDFIIRGLVGRGWEHTPGAELPREDLSNPLVEKHLIDALQRLNDNRLSDEDIRKVLAELHAVNVSFLGAKKVLALLKDGISIKLEKEKIPYRVRLLDYRNPEKNMFVVSDQVSYSGINRGIRTDITLYVNGIPLVVIECKSATGPGNTWENAYKQIKRYEREFPELFKYVQLSVAAGLEARYFPNALGVRTVPKYTWDKKGDQVEKVLSLLEPETLLDFIKNFVFFREHNGRGTKIIARRIQYEAANLIYNRSVDYITGRSEKNRGLIWHWQGSGKTFTMIFSAYKLFHEPRMEHPTLIFMVDRRDLEEQFMREFSALDTGFSFEVISSSNSLKKLLLHDEGRGKRGMFLTLIHKFGEKVEDARDKLKELAKDSVFESKPITERKNVVLFIDEAHRTQYGILASRKNAIFRKALMFAFTGTPIKKIERNTYAEFAYLDEDEPYLHKYFISDSISDGVTLPIVVETRGERKVWLPRDKLRELKRLGIEDLDEKVESKLAKSLTKVKVFLENEERIKLVVDDLVKHFRENIDDRFKAMIVTTSRRACMLFKKEVDKHLQKEYSEVVMTSNGKEEWEQRYENDLRKRYGNNSLSDIHKIIVQNFKHEENPRILIVTDMLLTGFDAPILKVIYLYKWLRGHRLLQTIARTNRVYPNKGEGLIIDYVGILKRLKDALEDYDEKDIKGAIYSKSRVLKELKEDLSEIMNLLGNPKMTGTREELNAIVLSLIASQDSEVPKRFLELYKSVRIWFELLGSHEEAYRYRTIIAWLTGIYQVYMKRTRNRDDAELEEEFRKYYPRVLRAVRHAVRIDKIRKETPSLTLDENYLEKLTKSGLSEEERIYDMLFSFRKFVFVDRRKKVIYEPIYKRVQQLVRDWKEGRLEQKEVYEQIKRELQSVISIEKENKQKRKSKYEAVISTVLKADEVPGADSVDIKEFVNKLKEEGLFFQGWNTKKSSRKELARRVRRFLWKFKISTEKRGELSERIVAGLAEL